MKNSKMNLIQLIDKNNVLIFNHFRIQAEKCISLLLFDKSAGDSSYNLFIYTHDIEKVNNAVNDDFSDNRLLIEDDFDLMKNAISIFLSMELFSEFESKHKDLRNKLDEMNIKIIILNNSLLINPTRLFDRKKIKFEIIIVDYNYYDRLIPIILFEGEDKLKYIETMKLINENDKHIVIDRFDHKIINENNIHFVNIPDVNQLNYIRSKLTSSLTYLYFYVTYTKTGDISLDGNKYNQLVKDINSGIKINYNRRLKIDSSGIVYT